MVPVLFRLGSFNFYSFSLLTGLGFLIGAFILWRRLKDLGLEEEKIIDVLLISSVVGLVVSRVIYAFENFPTQGFSFWGAIGGFWFAFLFFARHWKWNIWQIADETIFAILPFAVLAQVGALLDGSTIGKPTGLSWGLYFPGSLVRSQPISLLMAIAFFAIWVFFLKIERLWRTWAWYPSGNVGFIFLVFILGGSLTTLIVDFLTVSALYWTVFKTLLTLIAIISSSSLLIIRSGCWRPKVN